MASLMRAPRSLAAPSRLLNVSIAAPRGALRDLIEAVKRV
jgi:hypothetical protein